MCLWVFKGLIYVLFQLIPLLIYIMLNRLIITSILTMVVGGEGRRDSTLISTCLVVSSAGIPWNATRITSLVHEIFKLSMLVDWQILKGSPKDIVFGDIGAIFGTNLLLCSRANLLRVGHRPSLEPTFSATHPLLLCKRADHLCLGGEPFVMTQRVLSKPRSHISRGVG